METLLPVLATVGFIGYGIYIIVQGRTTIRIGKGWNHEHIEVEGIPARLIGGFAIVIGIVFLIMFMNR